MSRRLVIAIDCDDVLVPSVHSLLEGYNSMFGARVAVEHFYEPATVATWGTDDDDLARRQFERYLKSENYTPAQPFAEAIDIVAALAKEHELHLVTGRAGDREPETRQLLDEHFPGCFTSVEHTNHYVSSDYSVVPRSKGDVCREINAEVFIDDHVFHGREVFDAGVKEIIVFGDYPWNQARLGTGMKRCVDWNEVWREVTKLAER